MKYFCVISTNRQPVNRLRIGRAGIVQPDKGKNGEAGPSALFVYCRVPGVHITSRRLLMDTPQRGKYVFDNDKNEPLYRPGYYSRGFCSILKQAEIKDATLHTLWHTIASHLLMAGVDLRTVREVLRHSTVKITEKYCHLSPDHGAKAFRVVNFEIELKQIDGNLNLIGSNPLSFKENASSPDILA